MFGRSRLKFFVTGLALLATLFFVAPIQAFATAPLAARLLSEPYETTGVRVTVSNSGNMYGLANDGTKAYIINSSGNVTTVPFSSINMTAGGSVTLAGTTHTVSWGGASPSWPNSSQGSIAYSKGCLFITSAEDNDTELGTIDLYCIDVSDYSVTEIAVPGGKPLPKGFYFAYSNLVDFPDGRVGKVSRYENMGGGVYRSILRLYTITGTGKNATIAWSEDIIMSDDSNWAVDEHGLGTDGTYLYRIQWKDVNPNTKVWQLQSGATSTVAYSGGFTEAFGNMHFLSHNHIDNYYLVGHYSQNQFFITSEADPGPGPGNPLTPTFGSVASTTDGFTVQISNYDDDFAWDGSATNGGSVSVSGTGLVTVTGLDAGESSTVTITTERSGYPDGSGQITGSATADDGDGASIAIEDAAPNDGDGNDDGTADSEQAHVTSLKNTEVSSSAYITLQVDDSDCSALVDVSVTAAPSDSGYTYPAGLLDFDATCTSGSSTEVTVYYDKEYDTTNWVARKYIDGSYSTISGAAFGTAAIGATTVTTLTYTLTDGGSLDADGLANGTIEDPVGPAVPVASSGSSRRSGSSATHFGCKDPAAANYEYFAKSKPELCTYAANLPVRDLTTGMTGADVLMLQKFLNANGYALTSAGLGAPGHETTLFGALTRTALAKFQDAYHVLPSAGYFGPLTRGKIKVLGLSGTWW